MQEQVDYWRERVAGRDQESMWGLLYLLASAMLASEALYIVVLLCARMGGMEWGYFLDSSGSLREDSFPVIVVAALCLLSVVQLVIAWLLTRYGHRWVLRRLNLHELANGDIPARRIVRTYGLLQLTGTALAWLVGVHALTLLLLFANWLIFAVIAAAAVLAKLLLFPTPRRLAHRLVAAAAEPSARDQREDAPAQVG